MHCKCEPSFSTWFSFLIVRHTLTSPWWTASPLPWFYNARCLHTLALPSHLMSNTRVCNSLCGMHLADWWPHFGLPRTVPCPLWPSHSEPPRYTSQRAAVVDCTGLNCLDARRKIPRGSAAKLCGDSRKCYRPDCVHTQVTRLVCHASRASRFDSQAHRGSWSPPTCGCQRQESKYAEWLHEIFNARWIGTRAVVGTLGGQRQSERILLWADKCYASCKKRWRHYGLPSQQPWWTYIAGDLF